MSHWPWIERVFQFDYPPEKFPDLLERCRGTPARLEERVRGVSRDVLTRRPGKGWTIMENIGHLIDLEYLPLRRIDEILAGTVELTGADMTNRRTNEADHNDREVKDLLAEFRNGRFELVAKLESLDQADWSKSGIHPRLRQPMRIVDLVYFDSEHDDYHLSKIGMLIKYFIH